jgi:hypothetical protein
MVQHPGAASLGDPRNGRFFNLCVLRPSRLFHHFGSGVPAASLTRPCPGSRPARVGRSMPSLFIMLIRVVRFNPSRTAAPSGPPISGGARPRREFRHDGGETVTTARTTPQGVFEAISPTRP